MKLKLLFPSLLFLHLITAPIAAMAVYNSYFEMDEKESGDIKPFPKWTGMLDRFDVQIDVPDEDCGKVRFHPCSIEQWHSFIDSLEGYSLRKKMEKINTWGNAHPYIEDQLNWGLDDFWETPYEFFEMSGDCEDYAITKYYSLKAVGIPAEKMRIIILQDLNLGGVIHAVLGVYDDDNELYILDNQSSKVTRALKIYHYRPIFGINEDAWWTYYPKS
jgi:predicted transglutaminase-like cysteine proteinase